MNSFSTCHNFNETDFFRDSGTDVWRSCKSMNNSFAGRTGDLTIVIWYSNDVLTSTSQCEAKQSDSKPKAYVVSLEYRPDFFFDI